jgi:uncharacterized protein (DUF305 family)
MNKKIVITAVSGIIIGVVGTTGIVALRNNGDKSATKQSDVTDHSAMSMTEMTSQLDELKGDDFDKAFVEMMIAHHQGAIDMADLIPDRAKHDEIKKLGEAIISAQTKEIKDMKRWQKEWGYGGDEMIKMMHGGH